MVVRVYGGMYNIGMHLFHKREFNEKMDRQNMYLICIVLSICFVKLVSIKLPEKMDRQNMYLDMYCAVHLFR